jgi:hypothetical protein
VAFLRHGIRVVVVVALIVAAFAFVAGLPLQRLFARVVSSPRRRWLAHYRNRLMATVAAVGLVVLFFWSPLTGRIVFIDLLVVTIVCGLIAAASLEPAEPVVTTVQSG